jgi:hypothetical protein
MPETNLSLDLIRQLHSAATPSGLPTQHWCQYDPTFIYTPIRMIRIRMAL